MAEGEPNETEGANPDRQLAACCLLCSKNAVDRAFSVVFAWQLWSEQRARRIGVNIGLWRSLFPGPFRDGFAAAFCVDGDDSSAKPQVGEQMRDAEPALFSSFPSAAGLFFLPKTQEPGVHRITTTAKNSSVWKSISLATVEPTTFLRRMQLKWRWWSSHTGELSPNW
ncbi:hypothetical protein L209DRAFT_317609 [Thermothelomyces heterothallicus CBS 203.75]